MDTVSHFVLIFTIYRKTAGIKNQFPESSTEHCKLQESIERALQTQHVDFFFQFQWTYLKHTDDSWGLTQFSTTALVLDNVAVIKRLQDLNLLHPALHIPILLFQSLHCHKFPCAIVGWVVQVESHLSEVTLETEQWAGYHFVTYRIKENVVTMRNSRRLNPSSISGSVYGTC